MGPFPYDGITNPSGDRDGTRCVLYDGVNILAWLQLLMYCDTSLKYDMRSVRLDTALEAQLEEAARVSGEPVSQIIRRAIESQCREILGEQLAPRLRDVIGVVKSAGGRATQTGAAFTEALKKSRARR